MKELLISHLDQPEVEELFTNLNTAVFGASTRQLPAPTKPTTPQEADEEDEIAEMRCMARERREKQKETEAAANGGDDGKSVLYFSSHLMHNSHY